MRSVNDMSGIPASEVEQSRKKVGVPDDWDVSLCAAECGDIVFYPPGAREAAEAQGTPFVIACSNDCLQTILDRRPA